MAAFPGPRSDILNAAAEPRGSTHPRLIVLAVGINHTRALRYTGFNRIRRDRHAAFARVAVAVAMVTRVRSGTGAAGYLADRVPTFGTAIRATPETASVIDLNEPL
jgi:hypothetical protein